MSAAAAAAAAAYGFNPAGMGMIPPPLHHLLAQHHHHQQQQQQETFQISNSSELLSQNTYLNTIAWSPKIMPPAKDMTQKENLSLLDTDKNSDMKQNYYIG